MEADLQLSLLRTRRSAHQKCDYANEMDTIRNGWLHNLTATVEAVELLYNTLDTSCDHGPIDYNNVRMHIGLIETAAGRIGGIAANPLSACGGEHGLFLTLCPYPAPPTVWADPNACRAPL